MASELMKLQWREIKKNIEPITVLTAQITMNTGNSVSGVLKHVSKSETQIANAGLSNVDI